MPLKIIDFLSLSNVENFDMAIAISDGNFVIIAERHRADVIID